MFHKIDRGFYVRCNYKLKHGLDQCKDGVYYYKFSLTGHSPLLRSTDISYDGKKSTENVANAKFQKAKLEAEKNGVYDRPSKITIVDMFSDYLETYVKGRAEYKKSGLPAKKYFITYFKDKDATEATEKDFLKFRVWCREKQFLSNGTINRYLGLLSTCYERVKKSLKIAENPMIEIDSLPTMPRKRVATHKEIDSLWNCFSATMRDVIIFDVATGLRKGEIRGLQWQDVIIRGIEDSYIQIPTNKENNPYKIVALNKDAMRILDKRFQNKTSSYVFCDEKGQQLKNDGFIRTEFNRIKKRLGIENLRFHDLRHCFGTWMTEDSGNIHAASKTLGHSSVTVTDKIYSHARIKYLGREVNKMRSHLDRLEPISEKNCNTSVTASLSLNVFSVN